MENIQDKNNCVIAMSINIVKIESIYVWKYFCKTKQKTFKNVIHI